MADKQTDYLGASSHWHHYTSGEFGAAISLVWSGRYPREIVLLEDGDILVTDPDGNSASVTGVWRGFALKGQAATIAAAQTHELLVYW